MTYSSSRYLFTCFVKAILFRAVRCFFLPLVPLLFLTGCEGQKVDFPLWLKSFYTLEQSLTPLHWESNAMGIKLDSDGIVTVNKNYNPVTISQYALVCFDTYRSTGNRKYLDAFLNQAEFLLDTANMDLINDTCIGFPYQFPIFDLKPTWYSGLAQAEVLSVFIRYHIVTGDTTIYPLMRKIRNLMLLPVESGGLASCTKEDGIWIEEYPNSKKKPQVLNGFFIILVSLYEYANLFPDDAEVRVLLFDGIESLKSSVGEYDSGSWLKYDRGDKSSVSNWYMKAQILEMEHLYILTGDPFFRKQHLLWSTYIKNTHTIDYPGCKINTRVFSVPAVRNSDKSYTVPAYLTNIDSTIAIRKFRSNMVPVKPDSLSKKFQDVRNNHFNTKNAARPDLPLIDITFKNELETDMVSFECEDSTALTRRSLIFSYETVIDTNMEKLKRAKIRTLSYRSGRYWFLLDRPVKASHIKLQLQRGKRTISLSNLNFHNSHPSLPYVHFITDTKEVVDDSVYFAITAKRVAEYAVYYKFCDKKESIHTVKWRADKSILSDESVRSVAKKGKYCQFLVVLKPDDMDATVDFRQQ
ncbi:MAG: hypothetical protein RL021_459 [Bacteroidota bacterium]